MTIRLLIVDDQALVRAGLRKLLESEPDITVVGEAADGIEALETATRHRPDVILMDVRMPRLDGVEATRRLTAHRRDIRIIILSTYDLDEYVFDALRAGASGFLLKDSPPDRLLDGVRSVAQGDALLSPSITRRLIDQFVDAPPKATPDRPDLASLTPRELEVLRLVAAGNSNSEIADELVVAESTVKTHVSNILAKLDLRDRVQAVVLAYQAGLPQGSQPRHAWDETAR